MARTKQSARKGKGGKAPSKKIAKTKSPDLTSRRLSKLTEVLEELFAVVESLRSNLANNRVHEKAKECLRELYLEVYYNMLQILTNVNILWVASGLNLYIPAIKTLLLLLRDFQKEMLYRIYLDQYKSDLATLPPQITPM